MSIQTADFKLVADGHGLLEGPVFSLSRGLLAADATTGGVWQWDVTGASLAVCVIPHRTGIGGIALHADEGAVITGRNATYKRFSDAAASPNADARIFIERDPEHGVIGFNDITVDPQGQIYVGFFGYSPTRQSVPVPGGLFRIELDGSAQRVAEDIYVPNGIAVSPDGTKLYVADSLRRVIFRYTIRDDGTLSDRVVFASVLRGLHDGLAIASDGSVWAALAHAGQVAVYDKDGTERERIHMPVVLITSLGFGGEDGCDLYVVTGPEHGEHETTGAVFTTRVDVPGVLARPALVEIGEKEPVEEAAQPAARPAKRPVPAAQPEPELCQRCGGPLRIGGSHDIAVLSRTGGVLVCGMCGTDEGVGAVVPRDEWPVSEHEPATHELWA